MNLHEFNDHEMWALHKLAREKLEEERRPLWDTIGQAIIFLALMAATSFSIVTTIVVWSNMELFAVNISGAG
jgi:hypothetical protein